jgi:hypothetical protein
MTLDAATSFVGDYVEQPAVHSYAGWNQPGEDW